MRIRLKIWAGAALMGLAAMPIMNGQAGGEADAGDQSLPGELAPTPALASSAIVREIDDPHTGERWLLMSDSTHPGGPGRMVPVVEMRSRTLLNEPLGAPLRPVIHAGDRLIVEENTPMAEARLEATALGPAAIGSPFEVRLKIGGKVLRAVALAPGRAAIQPETGVRR